MPHDDDLRRGAIAGICTYVVWGLLTLYWKQLHGFDAFELIGWRIVFAALTMAVVLTFTRRWTPVRAVFVDRVLLARVCLTAVLLTVNWTSYVWAVVHDHVIEAALGYFIAPITTALVGVVVLHERMRRAQWVAMVFAVAAVGVLTFSYGQVPWLALSIAGSWTAYVYLKRGVPLSPVESMAAESFVLLAPAAVVLALVAGRSGSVLDAATGWQMVMVAGLGVTTVAPLMGLAFAAQRVPLTLLGPMQYSVPTINFLLGWLVYDESLPPSRVVGFALVWIGLAVITVDTVQRTRTARLGSPAPADVGPDATAAVRQP
jgi:chloramphenicol-sensitive protein RarD